MKVKNMLPILAGIAMSIIFGFTFVFIKGVLDYVEPFDLLSFRFLVAALLLTILKIMGVIKVDYKGKNMKALVILALFQPVLYFWFEIMGVSRITVSEASIMSSIMPIVVTFLAAIILKEIPSKRQVAFMLVSLSGVTFIVLKTGLNTSGSLTGKLMLLTAVLCAAVFNVLSRKSSKEFKPVEITFFMMCFSAIVFNGISICKHVVAGDMIEYLMKLKEVDVIVAVLYLGVVASIGGFFLANYMLANIEASRAAVFSNLTMVISIIAGVLVRKENFTMDQLMGTILILIGVWGTNYYGKRKNRGKTKNITE